MRFSEPRLRGDLEAFLATDNSFEIEASALMCLAVGPASQSPEDTQRPITPQPKDLNAPAVAAVVRNEASTWIAVQGGGV